MGATAAIVSAGVIGDDGVYTGVDSDTYGTHFVLGGSFAGILAAGSDINYGMTALVKPGVFENATPANKTAIDAIFTQAPVGLLTFDTVVNGKTGLALILQDLAALKVGSNGSLTGPVA
jgi:hypothetical protein